MTIPVAGNYNTAAVHTTIHKKGTSHPWVVFMRDAALTGTKALTYLAIVGTSDNIVRLDAP